MLKRKGVLMVQLVKNCFLNEKKKRVAYRRKDVSRSFVGFKGGDKEAPRKKGLTCRKAVVLKK